jgi:hypothetical protein
MHFRVESTLEIRREISIVKESRAAEKFSDQNSTRVDNVFDFDQRRWTHTFHIGVSCCAVKRNCVTR